MNLPGAAFRTGTVRSGEFTLDYAEAGPADAATVIVSLPGSAGLEKSTAKDRLAQRYRVVEINPPGWGSAPEVGRPMPQAEIGRILAEAATQLVDGPFFVIGTSMGGANALHLTAQLRDRVSGIVLEGSMAPASPADLRNPPPPPGDSPAGADESGDVAYPEPVIHPNKPWATKEYVARQMADRMRMFRWTEPDMLADTAIAAIDWNSTPILALLGDGDEILLPSVEDTIRAAIPSAEFRLIPGGMHDLQNTVPDEFVRLVEGFVSTTAGTPKNAGGQ
ncbi:alpha/beta fold hydrolase [Nocardia alni]|uniref:alpha/beta fold hydrolase n=1 Tax=Nocardia alni TaxID=2815723 RepID=UPI001C226004|nr:alpha/beta hydrolase [Nocardia alni]